MTSGETIDTSRPVAGIDPLRINHPKAINSLNRAVERECVAAASEFDPDPDIGA